MNNAAKSPPGGRMRSFGHHAMPGAHAAVRHGCPKRAAETSSCHAWPLRPGREHAARLGSTRSPQSASSSPQVETKLITGTVGTAEQQRSYRYPAHCPLPLLPPPLLSPSLKYPVFLLPEGDKQPSGRRFITLRIARGNRCFRADRDPATLSERSDGGFSDLDKGLRQHRK